MTKSYKQKGYCVSGLTLSGEWVRLVTSPGHENAVSKAVMDLYPCLDVISVNLLKHIPLGCQTENYLINEHEKIEIVQRGVDIRCLLQTPYMSNNRYIFGNSENFLAENFAMKYPNSLMLVQVTDLRFTFVRDEKTAKYKFRCSFKYKGNVYEKMRITDPVYCNEVHNNECLKNAAIVVSLPSQPYVNGEFYKFVAKIFPL